MIRFVVPVRCDGDLTQFNRSFAIRQMTKWGVQCILVRDLTDTMYDPQDAPQVSHEQGTELVVEHIEKYWAPSCTSADLLAWHRCVGTVMGGWAVVTVVLQGATYANQLGFTSIDEKALKAFLVTTFAKDSLQSSVLS